MANQDVNPVVWFEIMGKKGQELQKFYRDSLGWTINTDNPMNYGMVQASEKSEGIGGGIGQCPNGKGGVTVYIQVDDPQATLKKVAQLGGKTVTEPFQMGEFGLTIAHFADPQGNVIGLIKRQDAR